MAWYSAPLILNIACRSQEFDVLFTKDLRTPEFIPSGWTQLFVYGSRTWRFENGGYAPPSAPLSDILPWPTLVSITLFFKTRALPNPKISNS